MMSTKSGNSGTYLVLMTSMTLIFILLCGLVFGSAALTSSKVRLKNVANLAALAALNGYLTSTSEQSTAGLNAAKTIVAKNFIPNQAASASPGVETDAEFGQWYSQQPDDSESDPCAGSYPCFTVPTEENAPVNAARINLKLSPSSPISVPIAAMLGRSTFSLSENAIASIVPRCVEFILDASSSTVEQTHVKIPGVGFSAYRMIHAPGEIAGQPLGEFTNITSCATDADTGQSGCQDWFETLQQAGDNLSSFAPQHCDRTDTGCYNGGGTFKTADNTYSPARVYPIHYQSDYQYVVTPFSDDAAGPRTQKAFLFDAYSFSGVTGSTLPQPMTTFLEAFNAGVQEVHQQKVSGDVEGIIAFSDTIVSKTGLSDSTDLMLQLTNVNNANSSDPHHPNFVDWNWFPVSPSSGGAGSNITLALDTAIRELTTPSQCPTFAKKIIVLATDGEVNCIFHDAENSWSFDEQVCDGTGATCGKSFCYYQNAENQIMTNLKKLTANGIAVTVLHSSKDTHPNYYDNLYLPNGDPITPPIAPLYGYDGLPNLTVNGTGFSPYIHWTSAADDTRENQGGVTSTCSACLDDCIAFNSVVIGSKGRYKTYANSITDCEKTCGTDCYGEHQTQLESGPPANDHDHFYRPNGLMTELAFRTGGVYCPLTGATATETAQQAFGCVAQTFGVNPYALQDDGK